MGKLAEQELLEMIGAAKILLEELKPNRILESLDLMLRRLFPSSTVGVAFYSSADQCLFLQRWAKNGNRGTDPPIRVPLDTKTLIGRAAIYRQPFLRQDVRGGEGLQEIFEDSSVRAAMLLPLCAGGHCIGTLHLTSDDPWAYCEQDLLLAGHAADLAALVFHHALQLEDVSRRTSRLEVQDILVKGLSSTIDIHALVPIFFRKLREQVRFDAAFIAVQSDAGSLEIEHVFPEQNCALFRPGQRLRDPGAAILELLEQQGAGCLPSPEGVPGEVAEVLREAGIHSSLFVPIAVEEGRTSVLFIGRKEGKGFAGSEVDILNGISPYISLALHNASLYSDLLESYSHLKQAHEKLVMTEKLRIIGRLSSGVAHDFNNILAVVIGSAELLASRTQDPFIRETLDVILRASQDGAATVRRLQDFTRERIRQRVSVDLNSVVQETLLFTRNRWKDDAELKGISYEIVPELSDVPPIFGEPSELREAFVNLVLNALDAMPEGGTLLVRTAEEGRTVVVRVQDSGCGIPDEEKGRIFDPFYTTKGSKGTGLGLFVVESVVVRHDGVIRVESAEGRGTEFVLSFPSVRGVVQESLPPQPAPWHKTAKILVVEDDHALRHVLVQLLEHAGHEVHSAENGHEALRLLGRLRFDLVFSDVGMPAMSGWVLAARIREISRTLPVCLMTGWGDAIEKGKLEEAGISHVLMKPFRVRDVLGIVAELLRRSSGDAGEAPSPAPPC
jgi:signal transduction histidine kinase/ActR/RegA family two-component response regulator/putative methionine-R-sulfoxide reductase with GAF domain